ncbi:hypothetical protein DY926_14130 [Komagataeibacter melaceti]|uniref:Uncharacterized protein n=1 Tax=Komagataeibacter melaceti TaxID=2766577 RepID=A0A371YXE0_9PROT|nr:hypothetical protein [Komagataeibacter melaceti]RFD18891.1 hypothetical protein DY926_14130 [Komagataeibacter melaceti]
MSTFLEYNQLNRIRLAAERMADGTISVEDYNAVVRQNGALQQEVMQLREDVEHWKSETEKFKKDRDKFYDLAVAWEKYCKSRELKAKNATDRVAELERELAALKGRRA